MRGQKMASRVTQVLIFWPVLANSKFSWNLMVCHCKEKLLLCKKPLGKLVSFALHVQRLSLKYQHQTSDIIAMDETPAEI